MKMINEIAITDDVTIITVDNLPNTAAAIAAVFERLSAERMNVDMICKLPALGGNTAVSFTVPDSEFSGAAKIISELKQEIPGVNVYANSGNAKIMVSGEGMRTAHGVAAKVFCVFAEKNIEIKLITTSEIDISILVNHSDVDAAFEALKAALL